MRLFATVAAALVLTAGAAAAQTWTHYVNRDWRFTINFPGTPMEEDVRFTTARGTALPARRFTVVDGASRYTVTVADFRSAPDEVKGAVAHGASILRAHGRPVYDEPYSLAGVCGHSLSTVAEDGSRSLSAVNLHDFKLYLVEGIVPRGKAPPVQFQQSIVIIGADGNRIDLRVGFDPLAPSVFPPPPTPPCD
jgi:hypothetical protein